MRQPQPFHRGEQKESLFFIGRKVGFIMYIDTHAHIQDRAFGEDLEEVLQRSAQQGVERILVPSVDVNSSERALALAGENPWISPFAGIHPHDCARAEAEDLNRIEKLAAVPLVKAVGETGLDFHYNFSPPQLQKEFFAAQIAIARRLRKPLVIHSRESQKELIEMLKSERASDAGGVVHCFSGNREEAFELVSLGFYLGFTGVITFKKSEELRSIAAAVPKDHILAETDCPYLAPAPFRGKRNEPAYVQYVVRELAKVRRMDEEETAALLRENTNRCFGL